MTRINTEQPATAKSELVAIEGVSDTWETIAEAPDFSVPDTTKQWPNTRDPNDSDRRIAPGQVLIETPLMVHNRDTDRCTMTVRTHLEDGTTAIQVAVEIPPGETYSHPLPGQTLTKRDQTATNGDRIEVQAARPDALDLTVSISTGLAEQHLPE